MPRLAALVCGLLAFAILPADDAPAAKRKRVAAERQPLDNKWRVVCGITGCQDVPPGCRVEGRYSGFGVVYVVTCPRR
jgi:hypothetical protein